MTNINRTTLFAMLRNAPFGGRLTTDQVSGVNLVLDEWNKRNLTDIRWLAYMLATDFWETAKTMQPIREANGKSDTETIKRLDAAYAAGKLGQVKNIYWRPDKRGKAWFGRGLVQLTHEKNYINMANILNIPLDVKPELALDPKVAVLVMFEGMLQATSVKGDFTGRSLEQYFNTVTDDPIGARAVINGSDKAKLVASYYKNFLDALKESIKEIPDDKFRPEEAKPDDIPVAKSGKAILTTASVAIGTATAGANAVKETVNNTKDIMDTLTSMPVLGFGLILIGIGIVGWMIYKGKITINR